ncbi:protein still life, isoform SIF type 1-like [Amphibalanus amphitrite]|uniref:protein still life, isoform SIF type 1-like n=1 Tax=Amphibalanus amphitrite TaxID=1232801 RepID=UPI001C9215EF|nr:protein still life, isoform SIF type 1-like [Amphibalanus amphitrite]XP_043208474.1 protein still life, isoform SIF type 1-like [Amphibalanus amphitrite]
MGNSFIRKNYEESPWLVTRRTGNLLRLWAEVFHVSSTGSGTVKWQQISDDLVPVSLTCIQDSPSYVFHITAYNSQVDKILDVRLTQPGTRIGQASECFVYWKDPATGDTWGLNFTSPMDARQFREVCSPSFKFSRKTSSSYSLKLDGKKQKGNKRKPLSTPSSPSGGGREPQCTCMTAEQYARLRAQDPRFRGRSASRGTSVGEVCPRLTSAPAQGAAGRSYSWSPSVTPALVQRHRRGIPTHAALSWYYSTLVHPNICQVPSIRTDAPPNSPAGRSDAARRSLVRMSMYIWRMWKTMNHPCVSANSSWRLKNEWLVVHRPQFSLATRIYQDHVV